MRSNRPSYSASPAGSSKALDQKPKPRKSRRELNQLMLMVFFVLLPVLGLLAIFFQPMRWAFMVAVVAALAVMWMIHAFLFPGRAILSAVYGLLFVFTLVTALSTSAGKPVRQQQIGFYTTPPVAVTPTPQFSYSVMSTNVPEDFYADTDGFSDDGFAEGGDVYGLDDGYTSAAKSGAEIALENFMEKWRKGIIADMVEYTSQSWRNSLGDVDAKNQLFWKFQQKPLVDWRQISSPTGTEESTARTITVQADIKYGSNDETRTYEYDAIVLSENGSWLVDPDSLSSGVLVTPSTPTPDPNATPTPSPEPTPTPTINPKTVLYYNTDGGSYYHADKNCPRVSEKYLPLKGSFKYSELNDTKYKKLQPCQECGAPDRP